MWCRDLFIFFNLTLSLPQSPPLITNRDQPSIFELLVANENERRLPAKLQQDSVRPPPPPPTILFGSGKQGITQSQLHLSFHTISQSQSKFIFSNTVVPSHTTLTPFLFSSYPSSSFLYFLSSSLLFSCFSPLQLPLKKLSWLQLTMTSMATKVRVRVRVGLSDLIILQWKPYPRPDPVAINSNQSVHYKMAPN